MKSTTNIEVTRLGRDAVNSEGRVTMGLCRFYKRLRRLRCGERRVTRQLGGQVRCVDDGDLTARGLEP